MADEEDLLKDPPQTGASKNPLLLLIVLLNTILMGAIAFFQFQSLEEKRNTKSVEEIVKAVLNEGTDEAEKLGKTGEAKEISGKLLSLEPFTANLSQGEGPRRYLRLNAVLRFSSDSNEEEFSSRTPQMRDVIISTLNSKRPEDLLKSEGKLYLKEELKSAINSFLINGKVEDIYYVGFQIN